MDSDEFKGHFRLHRRLSYSRQREVTRTTHDNEKTGLFPWKDLNLCEHVLICVDNNFSYHSNKAQLIFTTDMNIAIER